MARSNRYRCIVLLTLFSLMISLQGGACLPQTTPDANDRTGGTVRKSIGSEGGVIEAINSHGDTIRLELSLIHI